MLVLGALATAAGPAPALATSADDDAPSVSRWAGSSRFGTAARVSRVVGGSSGSRVLVASGQAFPDALVAASVGDPVLLVPGCGRLPSSVAQRLRGLAPDEVVAVGGRAAVCDGLLHRAGDVAGGEATSDDEGQDDAVFQWSGRTWSASDQRKAPGPTRFSPQRVAVTDDGALRLELARAGGEWQGAEVATTRPVGGYGTYRWTVAVEDVAGWGLIPVLGLFTWDGDAPEHGHREIDIELARWGSPTVGNLWYTTWGDASGEPHNNAPGAQLSTDRTVQAFTWAPERITWETRDAATGELLASWRVDDPARVPAPGGERTMMNLWLMNGEPSDVGAVTVRIESFDYVPLP